MDTARLKDLIELMNRHRLVELEVEEEGFRARLRKQEDAPPREVFAFPGMLPASLGAGGGGIAGAAGGEQRGTDPAPDETKLIRSPLVGTFYAAQSPAADAFVELGDRVEADQVICIVEAMKVMNEVKADRAGVIAACLVENGKSVEFGTPLFRLA